MAFKLIWSPSARLDLKDIGAYIAGDSPTAADQFLRSLFQAVERLAETTKRFNEQVRRNINCFPADFMFQLTSEKKLRWSQIATTWQTSLAK